MSSPSLSLINISAVMQSAQLKVGLAMGSCLALWFVPLASGAACNGAETVLVDQLLKTLKCYSSDASDSIYWFFRKKMLLLNAATYVPLAGIPFQLFETYALGQFTLHCALRPTQLTDERWMKSNWKVIADKVFSGVQAVRFYEQSTGKKFPALIAPKFIRIVDAMGKGYRLTERVPGLGIAQEIAGEGIRRGITGVTKFGKAAAAGVADKLKNW